MKPYQHSTGLTGRDIEQLNEHVAEQLETIEEIVPADSEGNHLSLGNSTMFTLGQLPPGTIEFTSGASEVADPPVSQAQRRAMYAAAEGHSKIGIPQKVGKEFVKEGHGVKNLPERKGKK